jgi:hypothetical protein
MSAWVQAWGQETERLEYDGLLKLMTGKSLKEWAGFYKEFRCPAARGLLLNWARMS